MSTKRLEFYDTLKSLAIIAMIIDHTGSYFLTQTEALRVIGRISAPIFFFLVGYSKSTKIDQNILIYAILLQVTYIIFDQPRQLILNILFIILILRYCNRFFKYLNPLNLVIIFIIAMTLNLSARQYFEYGTISLMFSILGYYIREQKDTDLIYPLAILIMVFHICFQEHLFRFSIELFFTMIIILLSLVIVFVNFNKIKHKPYKTISYLAKYALPIYFIHKATFEVISFTVRHI